MKNLLLNSSSIVSNGYNDTYEYHFPSPNTFYKGDKICLAQLVLPYSWRSITSTYGNNTLSYKWIDGTVVNITIPDGFYAVSDLNAYLQSIMYANNHYLTNTASGNVQYYLELVTNSPLYSVQFNSYPVPTSLPTGYSKPSGATWSFPGTATTPQITIPSGLGTIIGFTAGTYPSATQTTTYSHTSDSTPQVSPVTSLIMTCSIVENPISAPSTIIYSLTPNVGYGSLINLNPPTQLWADIKPGNYSSMRVSFCDQNFNRVKFLDTSGLILLTVKHSEGDA